MAAYDAFNFVLSMNGRPVGGFNDVAGLASNTRRTRRLAQVTLRRGIVEAAALAEWLRAGQDVTLTLFDQSRRPAQTWTIRGALPEKHTAPALAARAGGDVAMEELVLSAEGIES